MATTAYDILDDLGDIRHYPPRFEVRLAVSGGQSDRTAIGIDRLEAKLRDELLHDRFLPKRTVAWPFEEH
eukprot:15363789-Heterocapsa_arctica.AAC.1